mmetsp:Transcript_37142/g.94872  ORF Transcript_37142/g.94872 Transcript_37142/m.94872 type:complete len:284 (-) Transcript_37142:1817-2668(-)
MAREGEVDALLGEGEHHRHGLGADGDRKGVVAVDGVGEVRLVLLLYLHVQHNIEARGAPRGDDLRGGRRACQDGVAVRVDADEDGLVRVVGHCKTLFDVCVHARAAKLHARWIDAELEDLPRVEKRLALLALARRGGVRLELLGEEAVLVDDPVLGLDHDGSLPGAMLQVEGLVGGGENQAGLPEAHPGGVRPDGHAEEPKLRRGLGIVGVVSRVPRGRPPVDAEGELAPLCQRVDLVAELVLLLEKVAILLPVGVYGGHARGVDRVLCRVLVDLGLVLDPVL